MSIVACLSRFALGFALIACSAARADEHVRFLHTFGETPGGLDPRPLTGHQSGADPATWALYGVAQGGLAHPEPNLPIGYGIIFKLTPPRRGAARWSLSRLYVFGGGDDGYFPNDVVFDHSGAMYGSTYGSARCGTIFRLTPPKPGHYFWTKTVLGGPPTAYNLTLDGSGSIYALNFVEVYKVTPPPSGGDACAWSTTVLHTFGGQEGAVLAGHVVLGPAGRLYGLTQAGGPNHAGTVYELSPPARTGGEWTHRIIYAFENDYLPLSLIRVPSGDLYGTTQGGKVFRLRPPAPGQASWTRTNISEFHGYDGDYATEIVRLDDSGSLYGATNGRLSSNQPRGGIVFRLDPPTSGYGAWTRTELARTSDSDTNDVYGSLVGDPAGGLYTAARRGAKNFSDTDRFGTIFKIVP